MIVGVASRLIRRGGRVLRKHAVRERERFKVIIPASQSHHVIKFSKQHYEGRQSDGYQNYHAKRCFFVVSRRFHYKAKLPVVDGPAYRSL